MTRLITVIVGSALFAASLSGRAFSQGAPQTISLMKVDPASLATGYRTSKVVGSTVVNEANETVGTRNVSTTLIQPSLAFSLDCVTAATGLWVKRIGRHRGLCA